VKNEERRAASRWKSGRATTTTALLVCKIPARNRTPLSPPSPHTLHKRHLGRRSHELFSRVTSKSNNKKVSKPLIWVAAEDRSSEERQMRRRRTKKKRALLRSLDSSFRSPRSTSLLPLFSFLSIQSQHENSRPEALVRGCGTRSTPCPSAPRESI